MESSYQERRNTYDKVAVGLDLEKQKLEKDANFIQVTCLNCYLLLSVVTGVHSKYYIQGFFSCYELLFSCSLCTLSRQANSLLIPLFYFLCTRTSACARSPGTTTCST